MSDWGRYLRVTRRFCLHIEVIETLNEVDAVGPSCDQPECSSRPLRRAGVSLDSKIKHLGPRPAGNAGALSSYAGE